MTVDKIDIEDTIALVKGLLAEEKGLSPALKSALEVMLLLVAALLNRLTLNFLFVSAASRDLGRRFGCR